MAQFPDTQWSLIRRSGANATVRQRAFADLARDYRPAILAYFRARVSLTDADDATQSFLAASFEHGWWSRADAGVGSFRRFLFTLLRRHLARWREAQDPIHASDEQPELADPAPDAEQRFDARFVLQLTDQALDELRRQYGERGRAALFDELVRVLGAPPAHGELQQVAATLGLSGNALSVELKRLRQRLGAQMQAGLRQLCSSEEAFEADWGALQQVLGR